MILLGCNKVRHNTKKTINKIRTVWNVEYYFYIVQKICNKPNQEYVASNNKMQLTNKKKNSNYLKIIAKY